MITKLNKIERLKQELAPSDFDINSIDFNNLSEADRFYLKNFGIYNIKLAPDTFMLRVRLDGGVVLQNKMLGLIDIAKEFWLKLIFTTRAGLELHYIKPSEVLQVFSKVRELGFETSQSLTDNVRNIVTDVYDGIALDSKIDCAPIIKQFREEFLDRAEFFGTIPRKFNTAIIGRVEPMLNHWGSDLLFALARRGDEFGFNIYLGGKNSEVAKDANIFVAPSEAPKLFRAVVIAYKELGLRGSRSKTRLFHLLESIGIESFRDKVQKHFGKELESKAELLMQNSNYKMKTLLKSAKFALVHKCNYGEPNLNELKELLKSYTIRVGADQNIHIIGADSETKEPISAPVKACAGSRYCPLSLWDIKQDVEPLGLQELAKLGISVGFSGCLKGCGHHFHSDIGLVGLRTNLYGDTQKALRVYFGATELPNPNPARLLYFAVPLSKIDTLFSAILKLYKSSGFSTFRELSEYLLKYDIETLQLLFLKIALNRVKEELYNLIFNSSSSNIDLITALLEKNEPIKKEELNRVISENSHILWGSR